MDTEHLEGFLAGVLGHTDFKMIENTVRLATSKDVRKVCLALIKHAVEFEYSVPNIIEVK